MGQSWLFLDGKSPFKSPIASRRDPNIYRIFTVRRHPFRRVHAVPENARIDHGGNARVRDVGHHYRKLRARSRADRVPDLRDYRVNSERVRRAGFATTFTVDDAFVDIASAVRAGAFADPRSPAHAAAPVLRA